MEERTYEEENQILHHWERIGYNEGYYNLKTRVLDDGREIKEAYEKGSRKGNEKRMKLYKEVMENTNTLIDYDKKRRSYLRTEGYLTGLGRTISTDIFLSNQDKLEYKKGVVEAKIIKEYESNASMSFDDYLEEKRYKRNRRR